MMLMFMVKGLAIGLSIAAPVGPIGLLCIRRSLTDGRRVGFVTGLGAATADAVYGAVAAFGLTTISQFLVGQSFWLRLIGGAFLCYLGARIFISQPSTKPAQEGSTRLLPAFASTFVLTLTNPMTILSFMAVFSGFGLGVASTYSSAGVLVLGVFLGSALWWLALSSATSVFRARINYERLRIVNRISGIFIVGFGVFALWTGFVGQ